MKKRTGSGRPITVTTDENAETVEEIICPANIRLDEDVLKTSFVFVFRRRLEDVLIKRNMFTLALSLQKTSSRRLQEVLVKINIFVLTIRLQDVFKTSSRHLQDIFKTSSRRIIKLNCSC